MFFLVALLIWTLFHVYVAQRLISGFEIKGKWRTGVIAVFALMWPGLIVSAILERKSQAILVRVFSIVSADWVGVLFLAFVCLLVADIATGFGFLLPKVTKPARRYALLVAVVLSAIALVQGMRTPVIRHYQVKLERLPKELDRTAVVLASDFHVGSILGKDWAAERVSEINRLHPDVIILAGDIVEGHGDASADLARKFGMLSAPMGVWAVNGNHERYGRTTSFLQEAGANVLHNEWKEVRPGLVIAGVDDLSERGRDKAPADSVRKALAGIPKGSAVVFISHSPSLPELAAEMGSGLMVSGHTHNGQIWPFNYIVQVFFPRIHGLYAINGMPLIVCAGTGTWGPRMRLWSRGEIVTIVLRSPEA
jgi:predicted MPP superfamily phosphohydrolase